MMKWRGRRIRYADESLVFYTFFIPWLLITAVLLFFCNMSLLMEIEKQGLLFIDSVNFDSEYLLQHIIFPAVAVGLITAAAYALIQWKYPYLLHKIRHKQNIARLIISNGWCVYDKRNSTKEGFFKDSRRKRQTEKIIKFPKVWYRMVHGRIHITCEIPMTSYQDAFLHLEKHLETSLYAELEEKIMYEGYIEYVFLYDLIGFRIPIDQVQAEDGKLRLMSNVWWEYDTLPHLLIAGGTGGGKSYFILSIIESLLRIKSEIYVCDPKNSDLADLQDVMPNVCYLKEDIIDTVNNFYHEMFERSAEMKTMENYMTGKNYAYLGLEPKFLVFDEYVAFMDMLSPRERDEVLNKIKGILMLGRQAGFFLILACQRPDSRYLAEGARDQFNFRVALGKMSDMGYSMMFGETKKEFFYKPIKGRGYADNGKGVISEFYAPFVPAGHNFLKEIEKLSKESSYA